MGWFNLLVIGMQGTGNGAVLTIWGWTRVDAVDRARALGYIVLAQEATPSTASTSQVI